MSAAPKAVRAASRPASGARLKAAKALPADPLPADPLRALLADLTALIERHDLETSPKGTPLSEVHLAAEVIIALEGVLATAEDFRTKPPGMWRLRGEQARKGETGDEGLVGTLHMDLATPLPPAAPRLSAAHRRLVGDTLEALTAWGSTQDTATTLFTIATADDPAGTLPALRHYARETAVNVQHLGSALCAVASTLTGLDPSHTATMHAMQLGLVDAGSSGGVGRVAVADAIEAFTADD